ncbi:MAG: HDIG domain-containing metalloprotein [Syntrophobacteraceae bacterium]
MAKIVFSVFLLFATLCACYIEDAYLHYFPPQPGKPSLFTFRAQFPFTFDQEKAFGSKRNLAISQYIPLYSFIPDRAEATKRKMQDLIKKVSTLQAEQQADGAAFSRYLHKDLGVEIGEQTANQILGYPNIKNLLEATMAIQESVLQSKIVEDPQPIKGKKTVEVLFPDPVGTVAYPAAEFMTLEQARLNLQKKIVQVFWQVDKGMLDALIRIAASVLSPNFRYDQRENDRRIEEIIRRYPSKLVAYRAGEVLVPFRKVMAEEDVLLLGAHQEAERKDLFTSGPGIFFAVSFMIILYNLLLSKVLQPWLSRKPPVLLFLSLLILSVLLFKAYLLFTFFPIYSLPFCLLPILLVLLERERISASWTVLLAAMMVTLFSGRTAEILLFCSLGGLLGILASPAIRKRSQVFIPSLWVAFSNAAVVAIFLVDWKTPAFWSANVESAAVNLIGSPSGALFVNAGWAWLGGLASGPAALLFLPLLELTWHRASSFKLNSYADLQHPLMRNLLTRAPGTYQHTMSVAYLAEAAGDAIGANTLLLRTGAYYHDIGKTDDPRFFVENQFGGNNQHKDLDPSESARIIINHVKAGFDMGRKAGLPDVVLDFIPEHHGTRLVEYFYHQACKKEQENRPDEKDFAYPGPRPQSVETALLMIVDAVEAASRTLHEPGRDEISNLVRLIIEKRMAEGQFDECDLSTRDIGRIIQVLTDSLDASFHARVEYPWQTEAKPEEKVN